jgi:hypothetical protein
VKLACTPPYCILRALWPPFLDVGTAYMALESGTLGPSLEWIAEGILAVHRDSSDTNSLLGATRVC